MKYTHEGTGQALYFVTRGRERRAEIEEYARLWVAPGCIWSTDNSNSYKWLECDPVFCQKRLKVTHAIQFGAEPITIVVEDLEEDAEERYLLDQAGIQEYEGNFYVQMRVNNNAAESENNNAKLVIRVKRGVMHQLL